MAGGVVLAIVWIGVYWATPPKPSVATEPGIVFADDAAPPVSAPVVQRPSQPETAPDTRAVVAERAAPQAVIPPQFREYAVRAGDTMETIARSQLGDAALWVAVASANPRVAPLKLRVGQTIRIPLDPANIQGRPNPEVVASAPARPSAPEPAPRIEYVVRRGRHARRDRADLLQLVGALATDPRREPRQDREARGHPPGDDAAHPPGAAERVNHISSR